MKNKFSFLTALWWILLLAVLGFFLLVATDKQSRESEDENRMLAAFPTLSGKSLADASFMNGFEDFLSDAFFGRESVTKFTDRVMDKFSVLTAEEEAVQQAEEMDKRLQAEGAADGEDPAEEPVAETPTETNVPAEPVQEGEPQETDAVDEPLDDLEDEPDDSLDDEPLLEGEEMISPNRSYVWLKRTDGDRKKIVSYSRQNLETYVETLRMMLGYLPEDGQILFTQVPLASTANRWTDQPKVYCGWGSTVEKMMREIIGDENRIHVFNSVALLEPHMAAGEKMFYQTDHHWTAEGAYVVASEMIKEQGMPVVPYEEYEYKAIRSKARTKEGVHDTFNVLYSLLPARSLIVTNRTTETELSLMNYSSTTYRAYMNNTRKPWRRIITGFNTGRKALVICDSFGNAFAPYLLPYYDEVHMTDFRKGDYDKALAGGSMGELMQYFGIDDVYIVISTANDLRKNNSLIYLRKYLVE
ncbi:MAG: DHHW family protein [Clostridia bacterium]|nr:DHHW family protein [Clostridia bacterium]